MVNVSKLPKAEKEVVVKCPNCKWYGDNSDDASSCMHHMIEERVTERGKYYYHCTCCGCDFKE